MPAIARSAREGCPSQPRQPTRSARSTTLAHTPCPRAGDRTETTITILSTRDTDGATELRTPGRWERLLATWLITVLGGDRADLPLRDSLAHLLAVPAEADCCGE
jgi:hypothetical protein